jgi:hypothetical protein
MTTIRVSVLIDTKSTVVDLDSIREDLLETVEKMTRHSPDHFLLKELDQNDESDWQEIDEHDEVITVINV